MSGPVDLAAAQRGLAAVAQTLLQDGRTAYAYPAAGVQRGDAVVMYPMDEPISLAATFQRGGDELQLYLAVLCGLEQDPDTLDEIAAWIKGTDDVEAAVRSSHGFSGAVDDAWVTEARVSTYTTLGQPADDLQLAVVFTVKIVS